MNELDDHQLLAQFARESSETAFATLVRRYLNLVFSAARRHADSDHAAEEITQAVFIILARKAGDLSPRTVLSGWLWQTARLAAANHRRAEVRRARREQEAYMQSQLNDPQSDPTWQAIAPLLDDALGQLGGRDRDALVLRFFENKNLREVGQALGASEDAAKMRVNRALDKLRKIFSKHGVALTATIIAGAVSANAVQAAPASLAVTVTAAAQGASFSATLTTLVKGTMKTMTWLKLKFAVGAGVTALLVGGVAAVAVSQTERGDQLTPQAIAKQSLDTYVALASYSDSGTAVSEGGGASTKTSFNIRLQRPNRYRVGWTQTSGGYTSKGLIWSQGDGDFLVSGPADQFATAAPQELSSMQQAFASATGVSGSATAIPATFYRQNFGDVLGVPAAGRNPLEKGQDENVGAVTCHVISYTVDANKFTGQAKTAAQKAGSLGTTTTTLWIGRRDHLIHQSRTVTEGMSLKLPPMSDEQIKSILEAQNKPATADAIAAFRARMEASMKQMQGGKFIFTQTHENIVVNPTFALADFAR
jgi:RNA polymerase sigma factor (sigma-70 family)